ncbi:TPA: DNA polymerase I [Candidatus Nomurabacteria bacterium]|nr:MAG: DNA polymerase [Parcubacteria bacterium RAAC4_OD1_1]HCY26189.1 DNA polymerase I [Candidatus Nomurabacteria bacterium]
MKKETHNKNKCVVLLDAHAIIHRAYHALPSFVNSNGEPTGAIYGLSTMLFKIITELKPDYIIACYDLPKKTFRHIAYADYKAGRAKADENLVSQLISSRELFSAFSIPIYEKEGFEADDILGTIGERLKSTSGVDTIIASGDMDTLQLVNNDKVRVYTLKKGINDTIIYNEKSVMERFGFAPKYLPDYKGLRGDPSDNIIGVKGIGEKTAMTLISKYHTIENLYKEIKSNPVGLGVSERILNILKEGEDEAVFSKTLATIRRDAPIEFSLPENFWKDSVSKEKVLDFFRKMEFRSLPNRFLSILNGGDIEIKNKINTNIKTEDSFLLEKARIAYWLLDSERTNAKEDEVISYKGSTSLEEAIEKLEEDIKKEDLSYVYNEIEIPVINIIKKMEENGILIDKNYIKKLGEEYHKDLNILEKEIWQMSGMEFNINSPKQLGEVLFDKIGLSAKGLKKSKGGARSTRESELEKLKDIHPIIGEILKYREFQKLLSTYIDNIPKLIGKDGRLHANFIQTGTTTGRFSSTEPNLQNIPIKTEKGKNIRNAFIAEKGYKLVSFDYSQVELRVAALMSQDSYFIKSFKEGKDIHSAVAMKVFNVDENGLTPEMRRRAKVINFGILYGMGVNALRENLGGERSEAQTFYDNYFKEFPTIASYLESIKEFAKKNGYTKTLFGRKRYFRGIKSQLPFIRAMNERMAINAPIQGTATADIIKIGMKKADEAIKGKGLSSYVRVLLQIHDELIFEVKEEKVLEFIDIIKNEMENVIPKEFLKDLESVPLVVSASYGANWGELK